MEPTTRKRSTSFALSPATLRDLKVLAADKRISQAGVIETLVAAEVKRVKRQG